MYNKHLLSTKNLDGPKLDTTQVRRKSCVCDQCGETALKENQLPNQLCEIAYHKKERLADVFLSKLDGARKYMRNDHKKKNFRIYARNPLFILYSIYALIQYISLQPYDPNQTSTKACTYKLHPPKPFHPNSKESKLNNPKSSILAVINMSLLRIASSKTSNNRSCVKKKPSTDCSRIAKPSNPFNSPLAKLYPLPSLLRKTKKST